VKHELSKRRIPFAKKSFGQNFLTDESFIRKIVDATRLSKDDTVVEIGPGRGALTRHLVEQAGRVIAIELDSGLVPLLERELKGRSNFEVVQADVLKFDLSSFAEDKAIKLVANLPYYISTAVLQRLIEQRQVFSDMVLMFQREVVDRIIAEPGNSERGYLTILVEAVFDIEKLFDVPPSAFKPAPQVWSSVVRITPKETDPSLVRREKQFERLIGASFRQKRKTIANNLKAAAAELSVSDVNLLLIQSGIDPKRRAETLTIDEWITLFTNYTA